VLSPKNQPFPFTVMATEESRKARDLNLDTVIDWKEIVDIYYQMMGKRNPNRTEEDNNANVITSEQLREISNKLG
jgi:hypothetical protein